MQIRASGTPYDIYALNGQISRTAGQVPGVDAQVPKARVKTRDVGFSLGKFGFRFTSEDVRFEADAPEKVAQKRQAREFGEEMDAASLYPQLNTAPPRSSGYGADAGASVPMRRGLSAYARQQAGYAAGSERGSLLGVA